jgi:hypothetical protein
LRPTPATCRDDLVEALSRQSFRALLQNSQLREHLGHLLPGMVVQVPRDTFALVGSDMVELILELMRSCLNDTQCFGNEAVLLDQPDAVATQLVELLHGKATLPLGGQAPHPLCRGREPCVEQGEQA